LISPVGLNLFERLETKTVRFLLHPFTRRHQALGIPPDGQA